MNKNVLWNNEMDLCIALASEMDRYEFEKEARSSHRELTGENLSPQNYTIKMIVCTDDQHFIWILEVTL